MSANLIALQNAINTNTLTTGQQSALSTALAEIIPFFPSVDDKARATPSSDESLAQTWISALFAIDAGGGGGPVPPAQSGTIIQPTAADLTAANVTGLPNGQPAIVESYGAEFSLQPLGSLTVDGPTGGTVLASSDPARVWVRGDTIMSEAALVQTAWHVNRGTGSNENTGLDSAHPLLTKSEIARRMGGWAPAPSNVHVTFSIDAADTDGTDPWLFDPTFVNGATWILESPLPAAGFTGSLNVVTAKNRAANTTLESSFTTTTGAIAVGMLLVNATRGNSRAFVSQSLGAGVFRITQPFQPETPPHAPINVEVDTWAHNDAITGYVLNAVDVAKLGGVTATLDGSFDISMSLYQVAVFDPSGAGIDMLQINGKAATAVYESACARSPYLNPGNNLIIEFANNFIVAAEAVALTNTNDDDGATTGAFSGGALITAGTRLAQCELIRDIQMGDEGGTFNGCALDNVFWAGGTLHFLGNTEAAGTQYGAGTLNSIGTFNYGSEPSAVAAFPLTGGLQINGVTNAYSNHTPGGVGTATTVNLVALTPAHLDAAAGAAGFGGLAYIPAVGCFTNGSIAP